MPKLNLDRQMLSKFLDGNHQAIVAFERVLEDVGTTLPSTIEEANANAATAIAVAQGALSVLTEFATTLDQLDAAPAHAETEDQDDTAPRIQVGTLAAQNNDAVDITGGRIGLDAGTVGAPSFYLGGEDTTGLYRVGANSWGLSIAGVNLVTWSGTAAAFLQNISTTKQLVSTIAIGTAPLVVTSTTLVPNLYVARAALADAATLLASPTTFPADATDLPTVITLANALRAAAITKGL
jgi:hypothetical protein